MAGQSLYPTFRSKFMPLMGRPGLTGQVDILYSRPKSNLNLTQTEANTVGRLSMQSIVGHKFLAFFVVGFLFAPLAYAYGGPDAPGFFSGLWDGAVWLAHFVAKMWSDSYVYNDYNNGFFYNLGFFLALLSVGWNWGIVASIFLIIWHFIVVVFALILAR